MKRRLSTLLLAGFLGVSGLSSALGGCETAPTCHDICRHICDICHDDCDPSNAVDADEIDGCIQGCQQQDPDEGRRGCLMDTDSCEDLWRC